MPVLLRHRATPTPALEPGQSSIDTDASGRLRATDHLGADVTASLFPPGSGSSGGDFQTDERASSPGGVYALSRTPSGAFIQVFLDGRLLSRSAYSVAGTTLTLIGVDPSLFDLLSTTYSVSGTSTFETDERASSPGGVYVLSRTPNGAFIQVFLDGRLLSRSLYSVSGTTLTLIGVDSSLFDLLTATYSY